MPITPAKPQWDSVTDAERSWLDAFWSTPLTAQARLLERLRAAGYSPAQVSGVLGFVTAKTVGQPDGLSPSMRSKYRKALRAIGGPETPIMYVAPGRRRVA